MEPEPEPELAAALGFLPESSVRHSTSEADFVGQGGAGIVRKGWLTLADGTTIEVAIKELAPGATPREVHKFGKEFQIAYRASQRCAGACKIYGCVHRGQALCLVMQLYTMSLYELLDARRDPSDDARRQPLPVAEMAAFARQIAAALAELHAAGIAVQDLKPANVLIDEEQRLVVADYGLAAMTDSSIMRTTRTGDGAGTPNYMAPEQFDSEVFGSKSPQTDIWALGCIIVEMVIGEAPWSGKRQPEIMMNVAFKKKAPPIPAGLPDALAAALRGCFSHSQDARPSAAEVVATLDLLVAPVASARDVSAGGQMIPSELWTELDRRVAQATQGLQTQVHTLTQRCQVAEQQVTQLLQVQARADGKLGVLARQLEEQTADDAMVRRIQDQLSVLPSGGPSLSPVVIQWLADLEQQLVQQHAAPEPEPQGAQAYARAPAPRAALAARSAAAAAGGTDPLTAEMEKHGLTQADQAQLIQDGVTTVQIFQMLTDADFEMSGIDIVARRAAKAASDQAAADAAGVRELLRHEGEQISAAGQAAIIQGAGTMTKLCALDLQGMKPLGLSIVDRRLLSNLLESSPSVGRFRLRLEIPALMAVSDAGFGVLEAAGVSNLSALLSLGQNKKAKKALLLKLSKADAALVDPLMAPPGWAKSTCATVDTSGEGGMLANNSAGGNAYGPHALGTRPFAAAGEAYAEFTNVAGQHTMFGVARSGFAPPTGIGLYTTTDAWMMYTYDGQHYPAGRATSYTWASPVAVGETVGLLLRNGSLTAYRGGRKVGMLCKGLTGQLVWAADFHQKNDTLRLSTTAAAPK